MALRFINLTPNAVRIWTSRRPETETVFPPSDGTVRIRFGNKMVMSSDRVQLRYVEALSVSDLPAQIDIGLRYIVSESVFKLIEDRKDFVYPSAAIRKSKRVVAHEFLACHPRDKTMEFFKTAVKPVVAEAQI